VLLTSLSIDQYDKKINFYEFMFLLTKMFFIRQRVSSVVICRNFYHVIIYFPDFENVSMKNLTNTHSNLTLISEIGTSFQMFCLSFRRSSCPMYTVIL
jgi:hypothetical protein